MSSLRLPVTMHSSVRVPMAVDDVLIEGARKQSAMLQPFVLTRGIRPLGYKPTDFYQHLRTTCRRAATLSLIVTCQFLCSLSLAHLKLTSRELRELGIIGTLLRQFNGETCSFDSAADSSTVQDSGADSSTLNACADND
eukprot:9730507-Alexandrium_andersonii.AAC.2